MTRRGTLNWFATIVLVAGGTLWRDHFGVACLLVGLGAVTNGLLTASYSSLIDVIGERNDALWALVERLEGMREDNHTFGYAADQLRMVLMGVRQ